MRKCENICAIQFDEIGNDKKYMPTTAAAAVCKNMRMIATNSKNNDKKGKTANQCDKTSTSKLCVQSFRKTS